MRFVTVLMVGLAISPRLPADVLVADDSRGAPCVGETIRLGGQVVRVSEADDIASPVTGILRAGLLVSDIVIAPDGWVYGSIRGGGGWGAIDRFAADGSAFETDWLRFDAGWDVAVDARGDLLILDSPYAPSDESGIYRVDTATRAITIVDAIPGFDIVGMDVPRAGPFEDGILVLAAEPPYGFRYYLWRYRREGDRSLTREGPFGPLDLLPHIPRHLECPDRRLPGGTYHLVARRSGLTFLAPELCRGVVQEFDLDGNLVRTFATVAPDPTVLCPLPGQPDRVFDDTAINVHCTASDDVYVLANRRLYHYDPAGNLVRKIDWLFDEALAITDAEFVPFASAGITCEPRSTGYWKRQCLAEDQGRPMFQARRRGGGGRLPPGPPVHPSREGRNPVSVLIARVDAQLRPHGVTACEALWPAEPSERQSKALVRYATVLLNLEDKRLGRGCQVLRDGAATTVGAVLREIESLLLDASDASVDQAARLAALLLHETAEE